MSWDADLVCECCGTTLREWNYTHNCNGMIAEALASIGCVNAKELPSDHIIWQAIGPPWWERLNRCDGPTGADFLAELVNALEADPDRFQAMNPPNGWGDYDSLVKVLADMRDAVPECRTRWETSG